MDDILHGLSTCIWWSLDDLKVYTKILWIIFLHINGLIYKKGYHVDKDFTIVPQVFTKLIGLLI